MSKTKMTRAELFAADAGTLRCDCGPSDTCQCDGGLLLDCGCTYKDGVPWETVYEWQQHRNG